MSSPTKEFSDEAGTKINGGVACVAALWARPAGVQLELPHRGLIIANSLCCAPAFFVVVGVGCPSPLTWVRPVAAFLSPSLSVPRLCAVGTHTERTQEK